MRAADPVEPGRFILGDELVECRSGYTYPECPVAFFWLGDRLEVERIESEWRSPDGKGFRVQARNGQIFDLFYIELYDQWQISPV